MCERFLTLPFTDDLGHHGILIIRDLEDVVQLVESNSPAPGPVSYTHLTLPTIYSV